MSFFLCDASSAHIDIFPLNREYEKLKFLGQKAI